MNLDDMKSAWQSQATGTALRVDPAMLLNEVRRNDRQFQSVLFWRDVREIGVALILVPVWFVLGTRMDLPWTWYLCVPGLLWVAGFMWACRLRQRNNRVMPDDSLLDGVKHSLAQVEHQIWLLRNVLWWYLLPIAVPMLLFFAQVSWRDGRDPWQAVVSFAGPAALVCVVYGWVYVINQRCVRNDLEPRRRELETLLRSLTGPADPDDSSARTLNSGSTRRMNFDFKSFALGVVFTLAAGGMLAWALQSAQNTPASGAVSGPVPAVGDDAVTQLLVPILQKHDLPAMTAAIVTSDGVEFVGAVGVRKRGTDVPVSSGDLWHLGSDGKAMTATLVAKLVEQGRLKWDATMAELFPELAGKMHPKFKAVTVAELLQHRAGLPANLSLRAYLGDDVRALRARAVREHLARAPAQEPGAKFEYSNLGYIIAGAVVEKITGQTWERVITDELFTPLGMTTAGFGGTGTPGKVDQPWPHSEKGRPARSNGPEMDNPPVMGPAGRIHCSMQDWAKFIQDQLRGARGEPGLLQPESYRALHTPPPGGDYALGWSVVERGWGGGMVLNHGGDNTLNRANVWVAPKKNMAFLVCVNQSGDTAFRATDDAVVALMKLHNERRAATK
jgi:CubicO group peptidase (beta-lactamase class C family)